MISEAGLTILGIETFQSRLSVKFNKLMSDAMSDDHTDAIDQENLIANLTALKEEYQKLEALKEKIQDENL